MNPKKSEDTLTALEAYASACGKYKIKATVDSIDGQPVNNAYAAAASTHPARFAQHLRRLTKNPYASQLRGQAEAAQAMAAIANINPGPANT